MRFALFGAAILRTGVVASWLGSVAIVAGAVSAVIGVDVGYSGLASGLQDVLGLLVLALVLAFAAGVAVNQGARAAGTPSLATDRPTAPPVAATVNQPRRS